MHNKLIPIMIPQMGDLEIEVIEPPTKKSDCGSAESKVKWKVSGKSGWIIQHIQFQGDPLNCFTGKKIPPGEEPSEYWETWKVTNGKVYIGNSNRQFSWSDTFYLPDQGRTRGTIKIVGEVKFIENYKFNMPPWRKNRVPQAGVLPTTTTAPPGWNSANSLDHTLESKWFCCRGESSTSVTGGPTEPPQPKTQAPTQVKKALDILHSTPAWSKLLPDDKKNQKIIEQKLGLIADFGLDTIRSTVKIYSRWASTGCFAPNIDAQSRIFVLNRFLFDLPNQVPLGSIPFFGGWHGVLDGPNTVNLLWPFKIIKDKKRLIGNFAGYTGDNYLALNEFDYFRKTFAKKNLNRN